MTLEVSVCMHSLISLEVGEGCVAIDYLYSAHDSVNYGVLLYNDKTGYMKNINEGKI